MRHSPAAQRARTAVWEPLNKTAGCDDVSATVEDSFHFNHFYNAAKRDGSKEALKPHFVIFYFRISSSD